MKTDTNYKTTVVYIITKLELGGAQKICLSLFNNQTNLVNNFSTFLISGKSGFFADSINNNPNTYLFNNLKREISIFNIFNEIKTLFFITKKLRSLKKTSSNIIVHTHSTKAGIIGRWAALFAGIKYRIHTIHGFGFHDNQNKFSWFLIYFLELITSFITSHFICVSLTDAQTGEKLFPKFNKKNTLIRAAIDYNKFHESNYKPTGFPEENQIFIFGTIACFKPQKNLIDLLNAFKLVHQSNQNTRLEIIGDGQQRNFIENWIKQNNLENNIILCGWQEDVRILLKKWHSFVLSSLWEGLPCSIIEARMYKLPILSYDTGGIKEIILNGKNGFIYKQKDWYSLAKGMLDISNNSELYLKLQNYNDNLSEFKDSFMIEQHINLYNKLINQNLYHQKT